MISISLSNGQAYSEEQVEKQVAVQPGTSKMHYPDALRARNVEGDVRVEFVVDTNGLVESKSIRVIKTSHYLFTDAVKEALAGMRFYPAEIGQRKVRQLVQQTFKFALKK